MRTFHSIGELEVLGYSSQFRNYELLNHYLEMLDCTYKEVQGILLANSYDHIEGLKLLLENSEGISDQSFHEFLSCKYYINVAVNILSLELTNLENTFLKYYFRHFGFQTEHDRGFEMIIHYKKAVLGSHVFPPYTSMIVVLAYLHEIAKQYSDLDSQNLIDMEVFFR